jgi:hypothetical protein
MVTANEREEQGVKMDKMDRAIHDLRCAQHRLDKAHKAACGALNAIAWVNEHGATAEERLAARSMLEEAVEYCGRIRETMTKLPTAAQRLPPMETIADREAKRSDWYEGTGLQPANIVQTAAHLGHPVLV